jgi:hypothetical protein
MTAAAGPGAGDLGRRQTDGRALAHWHAQLASLEIRQLWVGTLDLRHLEVPVRVSRPQPLDPFHCHLLAAAITMPDVTPAALDARLRVGMPLHRWLDEMRAADLVRLDGDRIVVTPRGERALSNATYPHPTSERRRFTFVVPGPHYLPWLTPPGAHDPSLGVAELSWVADCIARPAEWQRRTGFPEDVEAVETMAMDLPPAAAWRRVAVAQSERAPVVITVAASGTMHAFVPDAAGAIHAHAPALRMADGWREPFPELAADDESSSEDVGEGWRLVGRARLRRAVRRE